MHWGDKQNNSPKCTQLGCVKKKDQSGWWIWLNSTFPPFTLNRSTRISMRGKIAWWLRMILEADR